MTPTNQPINHLFEPTCIAHIAYL